MKRSTGCHRVARRCKALDASADGYVRSEACVVIVLTAADDSALVLLAGSAVNQDGRCFHVDLQFLCSREAVALVPPLQSNHPNYAHINEHRTTYTLTWVVSPAQVELIDGSKWTISANCHPGGAAGERSQPQQHCCFAAARHWDSSRRPH